MESKKQIKKANESNNESKLSHQQSRAQSRNWITTINNPPEGAKYQFDLATRDERIVFAKGQEEKGVEGTNHLQVYTNWKQTIPLSTIRKLWPYGHHEICKDPKGSILYCSKEDTRIDGPWVHGVDPVTRNPNGKKSVKELIQYTEDQLQDLGPNAYVAVKKAISIIPGQEYNPGTLRGVWIWGAPGTGKSRYANDQWTGAFRKSQNKWWDGYCGQKSVILDDLDKLGGQTLGHYLKIWGDRYPCTGEVKGFTVQLRHDVIVITSNYTIDQMWPDDSELQGAIRRRFRVIKMVMPGNGGPNCISASGDTEVSYERLITLDESAKRGLVRGIQSQPECMRFLGNLDSSGLGDDGSGIEQEDNVLLNNVTTQSEEEFKQDMMEFEKQRHDENHKSDTCLRFNQ